METIYKYDWNNDPRTEYLTRINKDIGKIIEVRKRIGTKVGDRYSPCRMVHTTGEDYILRVVGPYDLFEAVRIAQRYLTEQCIKETVIQ